MSEFDTLLVTGGAGFIGSNFVHVVAERTPARRVVVLDKLTYAGNAENLAGLDVELVRGDIADPEDVGRAFQATGTGGGGGAENIAVIHFAAETHVDRSIESALPFLHTNVVGTQVLLDAARERGVRRFVHISTDEVYGPIPDGVFTPEDDLLNPTNPYSASKAASEHLVHAATITHGIDAVITRCSNNYGPYQFPEKLIPLMIANASEDKPLPVYGDGLCERDWTHVRDHCDAVLAVLERGRAGATYNIPGNTHKTNLEVLHFLLDVLGKPRSLIHHVKDRPGHDRRYAPDGARIQSELGWTPSRTFDDAMEETVRWYQDNTDWLERVRSGEYRNYYERHYGERLKT